MNDSIPGRIISGRSNSFAGFILEVEADMGFFVGQQVHISRTNSPEKPVGSAFVDSNVAYEACKVGRITRDEPSVGEVATMQRRLEWFAAQGSSITGAGSARILTCVYCGHEYPQDTPAAGDQVLTDHIAQCASHPMRSVIEQRDRLRAALAGLVGASARDELQAMEIAIRSAPAADEDKAAILNALHALRDAAPSGETV